MSSQDNESSTNKPNFEAEYNNINQVNLTTIEALRAVFQYHKSIDRLNQVLLQIGKSETELNLMEWRGKTGKREFLELCEEIYDTMENRECESRREIGEMNEEILKMQKSLTGMGIRFSSNEIEGKTEENDDENRNEKIAHLAINNEEINCSTKNKKEESEEKIDEYVNEAQNYIEKKTNESDKKQLNNEEVDNARIKEKQTKEKERKEKIKEKEIEEKEEECENNERILLEETVKQEIKIREKIESHKSEIISNTNKIRHEMQNIAVHHSQQLFKSELDSLHAKSNKTQANNEEIKKKLQSKLNLKESLKDYEERQKNKEGETKWTELVVENKSFVKIPTNFDKPKRERSKYDPYKEISKYESRKKQKCDEAPKNEFESLYQKYRSKLRSLFPYFVKEMKSLAFTFDGYPNSLDINSFCSFMKHFNLNGICKVKDVLKHFKSCAINGTWLNEDGFLAVSSKIFDLPEHLASVIDEMITEKEKFSELMKEFEEEEKEINEFENDSNFEEKRSHRQKELNEMDQEIQTKQAQLLDKLKKINSLLPTKEVNRLIGKSKPKITHFQNYDPERLKKIVEIHSGIYQQDIIERLHDRKKENERKNELKTKKLLEKYGVKGNEKYEGEVRGLKKNIYSAPNIHKVEGYSKINEIKKGSYQSKDLETIQRSRLKTEPKYQIVRLEADIENEEVKDYENAKKIEVYRELSLPKLPKRQMRDQSIYDALNKIDTRAEVELIKELITDCDEKILEEFESKEKIIWAKEKKNPKPTIQQRMKFT